MGKFTINDHFQQLCNKLPEGTFQYSIIQHPRNHPIDTKRLFWISFYPSKIDLVSASDLLKDLHSDSRCCATKNDDDQQKAHHRWTCETASLGRFRSSLAGTLSCRQLAGHSKTPIVCQARVATHVHTIWRFSLSSIDKQLKYQWLYQFGDYGHSNTALLRYKPNVNF